MALSSRPPRSTPVHPAFRSHHPGCGVPKGKGETGRAGASQCACDCSVGLAYTDGVLTAGVHMHGHPFVRSRGMRLAGCMLGRDDDDASLEIAVPRLDSQAQKVGDQRPVLQRRPDGRCQESHARALQSGLVRALGIRRAYVGCRLVGHAIRRYMDQTVSPSRRKGQPRQSSIPAPIQDQ